MDKGGNFYAVSSPFSLYLHSCNARLYLTVNFVGARLSSRKLKNEHVELLHKPRLSAPRSRNRSNSRASEKRFVYSANKEKEKKIGIARSTDIIMQ